MSPHRTSAGNCGTGITKRSARQAIPIRTLCISGPCCIFDSLLANVSKNPEYDTRKYRGVIQFAENTQLWDAWEAIYTDLENPDHKADALAFFKANEAEMLKGTKVLWEEKKCITS